jgi:hypothetical protein
MQLRPVFIVFVEKKLMKKKKIAQKQFDFSTIENPLKNFILVY